MSAAGDGLCWRLDVCALCSVSLSWLDVCAVLKDGTELQVFVAEVKKQIVGVAVIRREEVHNYSKWN